MCLKKILFSSFTKTPNCRYYWSDVGGQWSYWQLTGLGRGSQRRSEPTFGGLWDGKRRPLNGQIQPTLASDWLTASQLSPHSSSNFATHFRKQPMSIVILFQKLDENIIIKIDRLRSSLIDMESKKEWEFFIIIYCLGQT